MSDVERLRQEAQAAIIAGGLEQTRTASTELVGRQEGTQTATGAKWAIRRAASWLLGRIVPRLYAVGYPLAIAYWRIRRPRTVSVLVVVCCQDQVLLVRHPYGRSQWMPPGGAVKPSEALDAAARREVREEVGIEVAGLVQHGAVHGPCEGRRHTTWVFSAEVTTLDFQANSWEIAEARWFSIPQIVASDQPAFQGLDRCLRMVGRA